MGINQPSPNVALHVVGDTNVTGNIVATLDVMAFSDKRLKSNLCVIRNALAKIQALTGYTFDRVDAETRQAGLIAQDVQRVLPEAVSDVGGTLGLSYSSVVALLIEGMKSLTADMASLRQTSRCRY